LDVRKPNESLVAVDAREVISGLYADVSSTVVYIVHTKVLVVVGDAVQGLGRGLGGHLRGCGSWIRFWVRFGTYVDYRESIVVG
jgi:hypothetical protein